MNGLFEGKGTDGHQGEKKKATGGDPVTGDEADGGKPLVWTARLSHRCGRLPGQGRAALPVPPLHGPLAAAFPAFPRTLSAL